MYPVRHSMVTTFAHSSVLPLRPTGIFLTSPGVPFSCSSVWIMPVPVIIAGATSLNVMPLLPILLARFFDRPWTPAVDDDQQQVKCSGAKGCTFGCTVMTTIDAGTTSSDRGDIDNPAPCLLKHVRHSQFRYDERASEIYIDRIIPLLDVDL